MTQAILRVHEGGVYFSPSSKAFLLSQNIDKSLHFSMDSETLSKLLTTREIEIIKLVAKGLHNREIASALGIKVRTVNFHVSNILLKLGVSTRLEAVLTWVNANNETLYQ